MDTSIGIELSAYVHPTHRMKEYQDANLQLRVEEYSLFCLSQSIIDQIDGRF